MKQINFIKEMSWPGKIAVLLALMMPLFPKFLPVLIILLFLTAFIDYKNLRFHSEFKTMAWLYALTYLFYVFGMLGSNHIEDGLFILQVKLSFLIIPLFFLFHGPFHVKTLRTIFFAFVTGTFINSLLCLFKGLNCYLETGWWECFFTSYLSYNFHTTYLSIYYCFSILFIIYYLINYITRLGSVVIGILIFLLVYFTGFVLLLSSKGGLIALITVLLVAAFYYIFKKGSRRAALFTFAGMIMVGIVFYFTTDILRSRINNAIHVFNLPKQELFENHKQSTESTEVRLMIWEVAGKEISKHPFGVGTGDAQYILMKKYEDYGMTGALKTKLNCHNQFYETTLSIGVHGLIVLIIFLLYILITAIRKRNFLLLWIAVIVILNLFFESMFETQAGVIFFVFFTGLLLTSVPEVIPLSDDEND